MTMARVHARRMTEGAISGGGMFQVWQVFDQENIKGEGLIDSRLSDRNLGFLQCDYHCYSVWVRGTSQLMIPDFSVQVIQSWDDRPENYVIPETGGTIITISDDHPHIEQLNIPPMRYLRLRLVGQLVNPGDTQVDLFLFMQA